MDRNGPRSIQQDDPWWLVAVALPVLQIKYLVAYHNELPPGEKIRAWTLLPMMVFATCLWGAAWLVIIRFASLL
jgi:hypothetical protein